jgi:uncharacterized cupredoxin-like copper-binding protein
MPVKYMVKGDLLPCPQATLVKKSDSTVQDLTGCSVRFHMKNRTETIIDAAATIVGDEKDGIVQYVWQSGDTDFDEDGDVECEAEFEVTFSSNGKTMTFPARGFDRIRIVFRDKYTE